MNRTAALGLSLLAALTIASILAPLATSIEILDSPFSMDLKRRLLPPGAENLMGTDELGRDVLARILHGSRTSLLVAFVATGVALAIGVPAGALAGARGGLWDLILTRLMEATAGLPALPILLLVVSLTLGGESGEGAAALIVLAGAIGITRWAAIARYVRGGVWRAQVEEYATAALALGASRSRLLFRHLLPGALAPAMVSAAFGAGSAVLLESALSFLGLGTQAPSPSWGKMVAAAVAEPGAWWLLVAPGASIAVLVLGFNLLAEGIRLRDRAPDGWSRPD